MAAWDLDVELGHRVQVLGPRPGGKKASKMALCLQSSGASAPVLRLLKGPVHH